MKSKKKILTSAVAVTTAAALLLGGTFAWQSISQTALNEKEAVVNPGGRLHDDFNGTNKDVYVENFADDNIFARVRLDEYFEITMNKGTGAETTQVITEGAVKDEPSTYVTHKFYDDNATDDYWFWTTGGETTYMPTFNKNKDSLTADVNGTYDSVDEHGNHYSDYIDYSEFEGENGETGFGAEKTANAIYDADSNDVDEIAAGTAAEGTNYASVSETHSVKYTENAKGLISIEEWKSLSDAGEDTSDYWVFDNDGWVYWSSAISGNTATGLLLNEISLAKVMNDSYYYAINVVGQFITADDLGKKDSTGFYADGESVSDAALELLESIGVDVSGDEEGGDVPVEPEFEKLFTVTGRNPESSYPYSVYTLSDTTNYLIDLDNDAANIFDIELEEGVSISVEFDQTIEGTSYSDNVLTLAAGDGQGFNIKASYKGATYDFRFVPIFGTIVIEKDAEASTSAYTITPGYYLLETKNFPQDAAVTYSINEEVTRSDIDNTEDGQYLSTGTYETLSSYTITATDDSGNSGTVTVNMVETSPYEGAIFGFMRSDMPYGGQLVSGQSYSLVPGKEYYISAGLALTCDANITWTLKDSSDVAVSEEKIAFSTESGGAHQQSIVTDKTNGMIYLNCKAALAEGETYTLKGEADKDIYLREGETTREYIFTFTVEGAE